MRPLPVRCALLPFLLVPSMAAGAQPAVLVDATAPPEAARFAPEAGHAARARYVRLDTAALEAATHRATPTLAFDLFDGQRVALVADRIERRGPGRLTWFGHVAGRASERALLTMEGEAAVGRIVAGGRVYLLAYAGAGRHVLYEYAGPPGGEPACHTLTPEEAGVSGEGDSTPALPPATSPGDPLDVMVVYSSEVTAVMGADGVAAFLQALLGSLNESFTMAGVAHTARLIHTREVEYPGSPDRSLREDHRRLQLYTDGRLDEVHAWRDEYHADVVVLLVEEAGELCGVANLMEDLQRSFAGYAFGAVKRDCALADLAFAHEVGHVLGARHDTHIDSGDRPYPYAHGYVNASPSLNPPFRTVMAYPNRCTALGISCPLVTSFSTTATTLGGDALGEAATADVGRVMAASVPVAASFRDASYLPPAPPPLVFEAAEDVAATIPLLDRLEEALGASISILHVNEPTAGTFVMTPDGLQYRPPRDFSGTVSFDYLVRDEVWLVGEGTAEITVRPTNDPPSAVWILYPPWATSLTVAHDSEDSLEVAWEATSDPEGDEVTYTWQLARGFDWFDHPLLEIEAEDRTHVAVPLSTLAALIDLMDLPDSTDHLVVHRVLASDGEADRAGIPSKLYLALSTSSGGPGPDGPEAPAVGFALHGPFPSPARGAVHLLLDLPEEADVALTLYDVLGRRVAAHAATLPAGTDRRVAFDVGPLAAGLYVYRLLVTQGMETVHAAGRLAVTD